MISPTKRQMDVLRFVTGFQEAKGYSPSLREIAVGLGTYKSFCANGRGAVSQILSALQKHGLIRKFYNCPRSIEVLHPPAIPRDPQGEPLYFVRVGK